MWQQILSLKKEVLYDNKLICVRIKHVTNHAELSLLKNMCWEGNYFRTKLKRFRIILYFKKWWMGDVLTICCTLMLLSPFTRVHNMSIHYVSSCDLTCVPVRMFNTVFICVYYIELFECVWENSQEILSPTRSEAL